MSQKAPKEDIPKLLSELVNRQKNIEHMKNIVTFMESVSVQGTSAREFGKALMWMDSTIKFEENRIREIKDLLPSESAVIDMTSKDPEEPEIPAEGADKGKPAVSQGAVEMTKGSEVLQPA